MRIREDRRSGMKAFEQGHALGRIAIRALKIAKLLVAGLEVGIYPVEEIRVGFRLKIQLVQKVQPL